MRGVAVEMMRATFTTQVGSKSGWHDFWAIHGYIGHWPRQRKSMDTPRRGKGVRRAWIGTPHKVRPPGGYWPLRTCARCSDSSIIAM
ncbi:protein of unknown function [Streptomyces sp. KY75]|nr:protein of unknown function [Streptomyces sp. KY75]